MFKGITCSGMGSSSNGSRTTPHNAATSNYNHTCERPPGMGHRSQYTAPPHVRQLPLYCSVQHLTGLAHPRGASFGHKEPLIEALVDT